MSNQAYGTMDPKSGGPFFGSDAIAALLRSTQIPFIAINPGASFRGLHDSIVNFLGNREPQLLLTLHEAQAVAMAHGYAKVTGKPLAVVLHANVGLMNAVMAIYDAWVDRVPMLILGATGAVDAARRRPWIEWIHTSRDQASLVRNFIKWDDQPASLPAALESIVRAWLTTQAAPCAPVYVCLDVDIQESEIPNCTNLSALPVPLLSDYAQPAQPRPAESDLVSAAALLESAQSPLLLFGRHMRGSEQWSRRIEFAEALGAAVICDLKSGVGFPNPHPQFVAAPAQYLDADSLAALRASDVIVSLDWPDLAGLLSSRPDQGAGAQVIVVSADERLHNGWSFDHFGLPRSNLRVPVPADVLIAELLPRLKRQTRARWYIPAKRPPNPANSGPISLTDLAIAFDKARGDLPICLTRVPFGWPEHLTRFESALDCIGYDGGGGIGSTPGITVGAALALKDSGRLPVAICGDGDLLMGCQALWTAAAEQLPALFIINNNHSFHNDVEHQQRVAKRRGRPVGNSHIGMAISEPQIDLPGLARAHGLQAFGPVSTREDLLPTLITAMRAARQGATVLLDVDIPPGPLATPAK
jgi:thiamine pyrophosphate-dependent acetolactate synthase large subunit-like protein